MKNNQIPPKNEEDRLKNEVHFYFQLFLKIVIEGNYDHGYTWSLGGKNRARQIDKVSGRESSLNPTELGILAIALSLGSEAAPEERTAHQYFLIRLGIINNDDILDHTRDMISNAKGEHGSKKYFVQNNIENAGKIIILRRAYEQLQAQRVCCNLNDCEDRIILGYIIALLSYKYHIRPYIFDPELQDNSLVDVYDHLFDNFSLENFNKYNEAGYAGNWELFLSIRDEIAKKKGIRTHQEQTIEIDAKNQFEELFYRMRVTSDIVFRILDKELKNRKID